MGAIPIEPATGAATKREMPQTSWQRIVQLRGRLAVDRSDRAVSTATLSRSRSELNRRRRMRRDGVTPSIIGFDDASLRRSCPGGPNTNVKTPTTFIAMAIAQWRKLGDEVRKALSSYRRSRDAVERDLFHGRYKLMSKNDDDLPVLWPLHEKETPAF